MSRFGNVLTQDLPPSFCELRSSGAANITLDRIPQWASRGTVVIAIALFLSLTACTHLYRAEDDQQAKAALKAVQDSDLRQSLVPERAALADRAKRKQEVVKRDQLAMRDLELALYLGGSSEKYTSKIFKENINKRLSTLIGTSDQSENVDLAQKLETERIGIMKSRSDVELERDKYELGTGSRNTLQCPPVGDIPEPESSHKMHSKLFGAFKDVCEAYQKDLADEKKAAKPKSALFALNQKLSDIEAEKSRITKEIDTYKKQYDEELKAVKKKQSREPGVVAKEAEYLQSKLKKLDNVATAKSSELAKNPVLAKLVDEAKVEKLTRQKQAIYDLLASLQSEQPGADAPSYQVRAYLIADIVNKVTGGQALEASDLMLQAELYRLQADAAQRRVTKANERVTLLHKKRGAMQDEILFLNEARRSMDAAKCITPVAPSTQARSLMAAYMGKDPDCKISVAKALIAYSNALTLGRLEQELADYQIIAQDEDIVIDDAENALAQHESVMRIAVQQLAKYYASGIRPEEIANLVQAFGLGAIALNVK